MSEDTTNKLLIAFVVCLILAIGYWFWNEHRAHDGTIVRKSYTPMWVQMHYVKSGKSGYFIPIVHPEHWDIFLRKKVKDEELHGHYQVSHEDYDRLKVGDYVDYRSQSEKETEAKLEKKDW